jgi:hypothetical protein
MRQPSRMAAALCLAATVQSLAPLFAAEAAPLSYNQDIRPRRCRGKRRDRSG